MERADVLPFHQCFLLLEMKFRPFCLQVELGSNNDPLIIVDRVELRLSVHHT